MNIFSSSVAWLVGNFTVSFEQTFSDFDEVRFTIFFLLWVTSMSLELMLTGPA